MPKLRVAGTRRAAQRNPGSGTSGGGWNNPQREDYLGDPRLPSERKEDRTWRTRIDPFDDEWERIREQVATNPVLEAKTIFEALQRQHPGKFADGQLRTLQRRLNRRRSQGPKYGNGNRMCCN